MNKYTRTMEKLHLSEKTKSKIISYSENLNRMERKTMSKRKIAVIAIAAAMVLGVSAFAASSIISSQFSSSSAKADYNTLPTAEQCKKDVGFIPVLIESFENGYAFKEGSIVDNSFEDESGTTIEKFKSFSFIYEKDGDEAIISQGNYKAESDKSGKLVSSENGIDIYYTAYTNKSVPANYKMTAEDKKAEASGELIFSYGSDKVSIDKVQGISWKSGEINFNITQINGKLTQTELIDMAKETDKNR